jgi:glyoxylate reductase
LTRKFSTRVRQSPAAQGFDLIIADDDAEATLLAQAPHADAILCYQSRVSAAVIRAATGLKLIQKHGRNCRNIDLPAARERGVPVATVPLMRSVTVAEHAVALMLACARKVIPGHLAVTQARYRESGIEPVATTQTNYRSNWAAIKGVTELFQASVGVIGMGDIGMEVAKRCRAFEMSVAYYQRSRHPETVEAALGVRYRPLEELFRTSDFVVLVVPHTAETESLIGAKALALMKPTATLVNVGRGGLIDEAALVAALKSGQIAMAGLDVYRQEPLPVTNPLLTLPNVVLLPHTGGGSYRSWEVDTPASLTNIRRFFSGEGAAGIINA